MKIRKYNFIEITHCNMCNSASTNHSLLGKRLNKPQGIRPKKKGGISISVYKCNNCGLIYSNPLPIPENIQDHYGLPPEEYWNRQDFTIPKGYFSTELNNVKKLLGTLKDKKALDVGAGLGMGMKAMEQHGMNTYGIEASIPFYERAIEKTGISKERLKCESIEEVDYEENSFDFVNFGAVLEHFYNPSECVLKAMKWLKPGGILFIEVPSSNFLVTKMLNAYYKITGSDYVSHISPMHQPFHLHEFLVKSFEEHSKINNNLYTIAQYKYEPCTAYMPKFIDKLFIWFMAKTNKGMQLCIYLKKN